MAKASVIRFDEVPLVARGNGIETRPLVGRERCGAENFTSGVTRFPPGGAVPLHSHNCDEQVTVLEGEAEVEIGGRRIALAPYDTTYIPEGEPHRFVNTGTGPMMILWIYGSDRVSRTFTETGETVEHLSAGDVTRPGGGG